MGTSLFTPEQEAEMQEQYKRDKQDANAYRKRMKEVLFVELEEIARALKTLDDFIDHLDSVPDLESEFYRNFFLTRRRADQELSPTKYGQIVQKVIHEMEQLVGRLQSLRKGVGS
jgi:hypothetical protein